MHIRVPGCSTLRVGRFAESASAAFSSTSPFSWWADTVKEFPARSRNNAYIARKPNPKKRESSVTYTKTNDL